MSGARREDIIGYADGVFIDLLLLVSCMCLDSLDSLDSRDSLDSLLG